MNLTQREVASEYSLNKQQIEKSRRYVAYLEANGFAGNEAYIHSMGWAQYYAGQIIGGVCECCGLRNGAHAYACRNHSLAS